MITRTYHAVPVRTVRMLTLASASWRRGPPYRRRANLSRTMRTRPKLARRGAAAVIVAAALLLAFGAAAAGTEPVATTGPVEAVGSTTATVKGSVDPNGEAT